MHPHGHNDPNAAQALRADQGREDRHDDDRRSRTATLHSRPMYNQDADEHGDLWFFTQINRPRSPRSRATTRSTSPIRDPSHQHYVSVFGKAEIVREKSRIEAKWIESLRAWFPDGKDDPTIALIRVHPHEGRVLGQPVLDRAPPVRLREGGPHRQAADRSRRAGEGRPARVSGRGPAVRREAGPAQRSHAFSGSDSAGRGSPAGRDAGLRAD